MFCPAVDSTNNQEDGDTEESTMGKQDYRSKGQRDCQPEQDNTCISNNTRKDRRTVGTRQLEKERDAALEEEMQCRESLNVWMECTSLLSTIAGVSYDDYIHSFLGDSSSHSEKEGGSKKERHVAATLIAAQKQLDDLQCQWEFSDTPILYLQQSIHRLQSNGCNFRTQNEQLSNELQTTRRELLQYKNRNKALEEAVKKLHKQNMKLRDKLKKQKLKRNNFAKHIGEYVATVQQRHAERYREKHEECEMTKQLTVHERFLRASHFKHSKQESMPLHTPPSVTSLTSNNRQRSISVDGYDIYDSGICITNKEDDEDDHTDANSSISSIHSFRSLVTDDISPTVRFESSPHEILPRHGSLDDFFEENPEGRRRTKSDGDVILPAWSSISFGKQKEQMPASLESNVEEIEDPGGEKASKILGSMFHLPKILNKENPTMQVQFNSLSEINFQLHCVPLQNDLNSKRKNILSEAMKVMKKHENEKDTDEEITFGLDKNELCAFRSSSSISNTGHDYNILFPVHLLNDEEDEHNREDKHNSKSGEDSEILREKESKYAFLVCGHTSAASSVTSAHLPDVGSRLVSVNDTTLEVGDWTIAKVGKMIKQKEKDGGLILTFRNDALTEQQRNMLNHAIDAVGNTTASTATDGMLETADSGKKEQDNNNNTQHCTAASDCVARPRASSKAFFSKIVGEKKNEGKGNELIKQHSAPGFLARVSFADTSSNNLHYGSSPGKKKKEGTQMDTVKSITKHKNNSSAISSRTPSFFEKMGIKIDGKEETKPPKKRIVTLF